MISIRYPTFRGEGAPSCFPHLTGLPGHCCCLVWLHSACLRWPAPAAAETSYHKLKKRLRTVERDTGEVLKVVGGVVVEVLVASVSGDSEGEEDDDSPSACAGGAIGRGSGKHEAPAKAAAPAPAKAPRPVGHRMK
jgi:hypothetical protein